MTKGFPTALTLLIAAFTLVGVGIVGTGAVAADGAAELDEDVVTVSENGTTEIAVESEGVESFEVVVGNEDDSGYELRGTVTPDGDGVTRLTYDHAAAGDGGDPLTADAGGVELDGETDLGEPPAPGAYDVRVFVGNGSEPVDVGTLMVETTESDDGVEDAVEAVTDATVEDADVLIEPRATVVTVPVDLDDGTPVEVRLRSAGNASTEFIKTREATVTDGEATATFDASVTEPGDRATLTVRGDGDANESVTRDVLVVDDVDAPGSENTGDEAPGFGPVVAALALLCAALVARIPE
ncbi:hypothetical protein DM2_3047 [Halorubrum sp. DM2]|nr:hypothetical protein DM2_3047 [Halorubrum sp. DM2]